ncbi:MAG: 5-(carboxyamino)imidazole ribonucleotide mutase [Spirochaetales bacterium]|nr:5-(carboxyamino)imidazole ribonucleotide mutase [Spirochaetales bacterium]
MEDEVKQFRVGVIMGSDSDLLVMKEAAEVLEGFEIPTEVTIVSAHRTVDRLYHYAQTASGRGIRVIIAGAGGAAHLPGMVAAITTLPVIGVPVRSSNLQGLDSLLSIVQMPGGVPVATVAINGAKNAGLLAVRILSLSDPNLRQKLEGYQKRMENEVLGKAMDLEEKGWQGYRSGD